MWLRAGEMYVKLSTGLSIFFFFGRGTKSGESRAQHHCIIPQHMCTLFAIDTAGMLIKSKYMQHPSLDPRTAAVIKCRLVTHKNS